jgi:hypothetical protein
MENILNKVGLRRSTEDFLNKVGLRCSTEDFLNKVGLSLSTEDILIAIGPFGSTVIIKNKLGLLACMRESWDYLIPVHELLAAIQVMVCGEVESEMDRTAPMVLGLREAQ